MVDMGGLYESAPRKCCFAPPAQVAAEVGVRRELPDKSDSPAPDSTVGEERAEELLSEVDGTVAAEESTLSGGVRLHLPDHDVIVPEEWAESKDRVWIEGRGE
jgi:hypothetical protein